MLTIETKEIQAIGAELFGRADFDKETVLKTFKAGAWPEQLADRLSRVEAHDYRSATDLLRDVLSWRVDKEHNVLEALFRDGRLPHFLAKNRQNGPLVFNERALMAYDETDIISERVYVETDYATAGGKFGDLIEVYIQRPKAIAHDVPILYVADPYLMGTNEVAFDEHQHDNSEVYQKPIDALELDLKPEPAPHRPAGKTAGTRTIQLPSEVKQLAYLDHYLARGYAVINYAGRGAYYSEGFNVTGTALELEAVDSVLRWVEGSAQGFYDLEGNEAAVCDWSNGHVGMTGRSYLGTLQIGVATQTKTHVLKTIVPEAAIASWYDYYRYNGLVVAPDGFIGEDIDLLTWYCESFLLNPTNSPSERQAAWRALLTKITHDADRASGQYNDYWDGGNYLKDAANLRVPYLFVQGTNDWNVKPSHLFKLLKATEGTNHARHFLLHRGRHISLHTTVNLDFFKIIDAWFDHYLLETAADFGPDGTGLVQSAWDPDQWQTVHYTERTEETVALTPRQTADTFTDRLDFPSVNAWERDIVAPETTHALSWQTEPLTHDLHLHGIAQLAVTIAADSAPGALSAMLIDLGDGRRVDEKLFTLEKTERLAWQRAQKQTAFKQTAEATPYAVITRGWVNLLNPKAQKKPLTQTEWQENPRQQYLLDFVGTDYTIPAGHRLVLVLYGYDQRFTLEPKEPRSYHVDKDTLQLTLETLNDAQN